ncbi:MAG: hypothetical protein WCP85_12315 [Mariniphaga sp.]
MEPKEFLKDQLDVSVKLIASNDFITSQLTIEERDHLNIIIEHSEQAKGILTVCITSIVYKALHPEQDIRNHQTSIKGGYSGRTFDSQYITPFLKSCNFPAMAESGWLTRSLEQKLPYDKNYTGAIKPNILKIAFIGILDYIQNGATCESFLQYIFQGLMLKRNKQIIELAKPANLSIKSILDLLDLHFNSKYQSEGASRLPVLAIYAIYKCLTIETKRFENKKLLPIESHTSADTRSGRIGDVEVIDENNRSFEAVEVKHGIPISFQLVQDAYSKFQTTPVKRYYILSTAHYPVKDEMDKISIEIQRIKNIHGCQLIVNGIMDSLKYYLRLLENTYEFIENYVKLIEADTALKFEHKEKWNKLISAL